MRYLSPLWAGIALSLAVPLMASTAVAQVAASPADMVAASTFIDRLADNAFGVLRNKSLSRGAVLGQFRTMLRDNFTLDEIGARLIRRYRSQITPAQAQAYQAVFPEFVTNVYAGRLFEYANAKVKVMRALPRGSRGDVDVYTRITLAGGSNPIEAIWAVRKNPAGQWNVTNLTVSGINVALTQEADFSAYIAKNGFDSFVGFLKNANARNGISKA